MVIELCCGQEGKIYLCTLLLLYLCQQALNIYAVLLFAWVHMFYFSPLLFEAIEGERCTIALCLVSNEVHSMVSRALVTDGTFNSRESSYIGLVSANSWDQLN